MPRFFWVKRFRMNLLAYAHFPTTVGYRRQSLLFLFLLVFLAGSLLAEPASHEYTEYDVKLACIHHFFQFVVFPAQNASPPSLPSEDHPKGPAAGMGENVVPPSELPPIIIGILGQNPLGADIAKIERKPIQNRAVQIVEFGPYRKILEQKELSRILRQLQHCQMLFITASERNSYREIFESLRGVPILTIGETEEFLEKGGIINFVIHEKKVQFEINLVTARTSGLEIKTALLKIARKVIK
jgi:hypothetical protein